MGLTPNQVNEIAKLPSGVAVIYQNDWVSPVLAMVDKAKVEEIPYTNNSSAFIKSVRESRSEIIRAIMEPWLPGEKIEFDELARSLRSLEISRPHRKLLSVMLCTYRDHNGHILWNENSIGILKDILFDVLDISTKQYEEAVKSENPDILRRAVMIKTTGFMVEEIDEICSIITTEA
jgi:hypothetical protein